MSGKKRGIMEVFVCNITASYVCYNRLKQSLFERTIIIFCTNVKLLYESKVAKIKNNYSLRFIFTYILLYKVLPLSIKKYPALHIARF